MKQAVSNQLGTGIA